MPLTSARSRLLALVAALAMVLAVLQPATDALAQGPASPPAGSVSDPAKAPGQSVAGANASAPQRFCPGEPGLRNGKVPTHAQERPAGRSSDLQAALEVGTAISTTCAFSGDLTVATGASLSGHREDRDRLTITGDVTVVPAAAGGTGASLQDLTIDGRLVLGAGAVLHGVTVTGGVVVTGPGVELRAVTILGDLTVVEGGQLEVREDVEVGGSVQPAAAASISATGLRASHYRTEPVHAEISVVLHDPALEVDAASFAVDPLIVDGRLGDLGEVRESPELFGASDPITGAALRRGIVTRWTLTLDADAPTGGATVALSVIDDETVLGTGDLSFEITEAPSLALSQVSDLLVETYPQRFGLEIQDNPAGVPLRLAATLTSEGAPVADAAVGIEGTVVETDAEGRAWFGDPDGSDAEAIAASRDLDLSLPAAGYDLEVALVDVQADRTVVSNSRVFEVLAAPAVDVELTAPPVVGSGQAFDLAIAIANGGGPVPETVTAEIRIDGVTDPDEVALTLDGAGIDLRIDGDALVATVPAPSIGTEPTELPVEVSVDQLGPLGLAVTLLGDDTERVLASDVIGVQVAPVPAILDVAPDRLTETIEADLTINASDVDPGASVTVGGIAADVVQQELAEDDVTVLLVRVPGSVAVGPADVAVTNPNGVTGTAVAAVTVDEISRPDVDEVDPYEVTELTAVTLTLQGVDLDPLASVTVGEFDATVTSGDAEERDHLVVEVPATLWEGQPAITVTNPDLGSVTVEGLLTLIPLPTPGDVSGVTVTGAARATFLEVSWTDAPDADFHDVRYRASGSGEWRVASGLEEVPAAVTGLTPATSYEVQVRGANRARAGDWSATATATTAAPSGSVSFSTPGQVHSFTVPAGYDSVRVEANGAQGGNGDDAGGRGGLAAADVTVTPGETLTVRVGGRGQDKLGSGVASGGYNGGANSGSGSCSGPDSGAGGGGASDLRRGATRLLVAGGGGGAGTINTGGAAGGATGGTGGNNATVGGKGGSQSAAGAAGTGQGNGAAGSGANGGVGAACQSISVFPPRLGEGGGGGGGGGWFGGGGGARRAGGGGGSSYIGHPSLRNATTQAGVSTDNGMVTITWTAVAPPTQGTPARTAVPRVISVLGDSISQGTGANGGGEGGNPGSPRLRNSWATGDWPGLGSQFQRLGQLTSGTRAANRSANGARMALDIVNQAQSLPADVDYVTVQMGGNDLCRPTVDEMTPVSVYRAQFGQAMAWIDANRPEALVGVSATPDIFRLWDLRRSNWIAVSFWALGIIPCQSLLSSPTSTSPENMARREAVRQRGLEYNQALREVCEQYLRCRYDDDAVWSFTNDPATFVSDDVSSQDYFHPSYQGQQKLAAISWGATFDFTNASPPTVTTSLTAGGVQVAASAGVPIAGIEYRYHSADALGPWQEVGQAAVTLTPPAGSTVVEVRAVDRDGNVSGSTLVPLSD